MGRRAPSIIALLEDSVATRPFGLPTPNWVIMENVFTIPTTVPSNPRSGATEIQAARFLVYKAAFTKDTAKRYSAEAAMAKLYASDTAVKATRNAIQIHGGYGFIKDYPLERLYRDAKITEIYEGTSEVQRMVIAGDKLK